MICPNINIKEVKDGFNEMVEALGGDPLTDEEFKSSELRNLRIGRDYAAMEAAYRTYHRNNGNMLDNTPDGKNSILFSTLLNHFGGDRSKAIAAKMNVYTDLFFNWFGDWTLNENSEPKVKFYGATMGKTTASKTNKNLVDFDDIVREPIKNLADKNGVSVRELKTLSGEEYKNLLLNAIEEWKNNPDNNGKTLVVSNAVLAKENIFDNTPSLPSKEEFVNRQVERGEGDKKAAELYYDDLVSKWMPEGFSIDNRYVSNIESVSKVVDENGEPLVVWHGTLAEFSIFNFDKLGEVTGRGYYTDKITGEKIPIDSSSAFFFTNNFLAAKSYKNLSIYYQNLFRASVYRNLQAIFLQDGNLFTKFEGNDIIKQRDFIDNIISPYLGFDVRKEANNITDGKSSLSKDQILKYADMFKAAADKIEKLPDARSVSNMSNNLQTDKSDLDFVLKNKLNLIKGTPLSRFNDTDMRFVAGNYDKYITISREKNKYTVYGLPNTTNGVPITSLNFDNLISSIKEIVKLNENEVLKEESEAHYSTQGYIMPVFLNIKNPVKHDYEGSPFPDKYKHTNHQTAYIAARQTSKAVKEGNDGVIYENVKDPFLMNSFGVFEPNQIKHVANLGTWSTKNDNIYKMEITDAYKAVLYAQSAVDSDDLFNSGVFELSENGTVNSSNILSKMLSMSKITKDNIELAEILVKHNIPVKLDSSLSRTELAVTETHNGKSIVLINPEILSRVSNQYFNDILLHELIHAVTVDVINNPSTKEEKEFVKQNYKTFSRIKKILGDENNPIFNNSSNYGFAFENEKEFAAYFAADPYFRNEVYTLLNKKRNDKGFVLSIKNLVNSITDFFVNKTLFKSDILKLDQYKQTFKNFLYNQESITSDRKLSNKQLIDLYKKQNGSLYDYEATIENYKDLMRLAKAERNFLKRRDLSDMKTASYGDIEQKLTIRIEAIRSSIFDSVTKNNLILSALTQKELFAAGEALRYIAITNILKNSIPTILDDIERIRQAFNGQITLSNSELMYQLHSNIGTYNSIFNTLDKLLIEPGEFLQIIDNFNRDNKDKITIEDLEKIQQDIKNAMSLTQHGINMCEKLILMNGGAILHGVADSVGATPFMDEFVNLLGANKAIYIDDVNLFELTLGAADSSANEAVRAVSHMCQKAAMNAHIKTIPVATRMLELKKALKHKEKVTDLYEKSFDKTFTGWLVRDLNFGLFYKDYDEFIKELNTDINKKYNLNLNVETNRCAPEGDGSEQARSEWESRKNKWLSEHCTRKYIPQYYEIYNNIPQFARNALHDISSQILAIHEKYISKGIVDSKGHFHYEVVSDEDWKSLLILWERRRVLKSDYNEFGQLREVGSPDYNVAKALLKFEKDLDDLRKKLGKSDEEFKKDKDAWKKDREEVIKRCGGRDKYNKWIRGETDHGFDEKTMRKWDERNSRLVFKKNEFGETKVFKDIEDAVEGNVVDFGKAYNDLSEQIREIKRPYILPNGDVDGDSMPIATRNLLIELYGKRRIEKRKYFNEHPELKSNYEQYIKEFMSKLKYVDTEAFKRIKEEIHKLAEEYYKNNPEFIDSFIDYEDILLGEYGTFVSYDDLLFDDDPTFVPYSWLLRMEAVDFEQYMEYEPGYGYADKEENANIFLDKNSKLCEEYGCTYVPKRSLYDNSEAYNKIKNSEQLKALYNYTLETIRSANSLLTNRQYHDDYQLPSITASILSRATRKSTWLHFFRFLKNIFGRFTGLIQDTNNIDYGEDNQKNDFRDELDVVGQPEKIKNRYPDGRQFHMVPQFYTKRMKYPDEISTNLVDIVSSYYNMSCLYDEKSKIKDDVETIVDLIHRQKFDPTLFRRTKDKLMRIFKREPSSAIETVGGLNEDESNTYKLIRNVVERDLYNIKRKKLGNGTEEIVSTLHRWTTARNLGLNPVVAAAGFFTTMWTHTINALTGYRYGSGDAFKAGTIVLGHIAKNIGGTKYIGDRLTGDKLMLIMEAMDLASQFERKTNNAQRDRFIQAIWKNSTFGFLSSVDFTTKALIAVSTLLSYRYVNGLFMTKRDILNMRNGDNEKDIKKLLDQYEGKGEYKGKKVTLYSVLKSGGDDNHQLICDEKYKDAYEKVRYRVFKSAEKYAEQADGMTTSFQKALITRNFLGALALIHRLYISVVLQETMGRQVYDYDTQELKNSQFANMFKFFHQMAMSTTLGSVGTGAFIGIAFGGFGLFPITAGLSIGFVYRMFMKSLGKTKSLKLAKKDMFGDYSSSKNAMISNFNRYQYRQTVLEVLLYNALIVPVANLICSYADDDKDSLLLATLAFWARRVQWETRAKYNAIDIINSMRTLSAATSVSDAVQQIYDDFTFSRGHKGSSIVKAIYDTASGEDEGVVKTGVYTDESKFSRSVQKATPYHNLKEQFGGYGIDLNGNVIWQNGDQNAKRRYNENKIQKLTDDEKESVYRYIFDAIVAKFKQTTE